MVICWLCLCSMCCDKVAFAEVALKRAAVDNSGSCDGRDQHHDADSRG